MILLIVNYCFNGKKKMQVKSKILNGLLLIQKLEQNDIKTFKKIKVEII